MADKTVASHYPPVISRAEARDAGLKRYFLGPNSPCKHNHVSERLTSTGGCIKCATMATEAYRKRFPEREAARRKIVSENTEKMREYAARYRERHPDRVKASITKWRTVNADKVKAYRNAYYKANSAELARRARERRIENPEREKERIQRYKERHPDSAKAAQQRFRKAHPDKKKKYAELNREKLKAYASQYREKNPEKERAKLARYLERHPERVKAVQKRYREKYPDKVKAAHAKYQKNNPEKIASKCRNRRARQLNAGGIHTPDDIRNIYKAQKGKCACCRKKVGNKFHVDHIQALSNGGTNSARNLQILCPPCNVRKSARDPIEFMNSMGFLL